MLEENDPNPSNSSNEENQNVQENGQETTETDILGKLMGHDKPEKPVGIQVVEGSSA